MASLASWITQQFFDSNGDPLSSGKVYTYSAGTVIPISTYTDSTEGSTNSNPIILDASGSANIWLKDTLTYKFVIKNSNDVTIKTIDYVAGCGGGGGTTDTYTVLVSDADTAASYLEDKLVTSNSITVTKIDPTSIESLSPEINHGYSNDWDVIQRFNGDLRTGIVYGEDNTTLGIVSGANAGISIEAVTSVGTVVGNQTASVISSTASQIYGHIYPADVNLKDIGTTGNRHRALYLGNKIEITHPTTNAEGIIMSSAEGAGNLAPPVVGRIGTHDAYRLAGDSSGTGSAGYLALYQADSALSGTSIQKSAFDIHGMDLVDGAIDVTTSLGGGRYYVKNNEPFFADGSTYKKILREGDVSTASDLSEINYGLSGVIASPQQTKHNMGFATTNGWYMPSDRTGSVVSIGMKSRSATSSVVGQTLKATLRRYAPSNATQRGFGDGTIVGSEVTLYTSDFTGTKWDVCGQGTLSATLTPGYVYYLDVSQISISCDDLELTVYIGLI